MSLHFLLTFWHSDAHVKVFFVFFFLYKSGNQFPKHTCKQASLAIAVSLSNHYCFFTLLLLKSFSQIIFVQNKKWQIIGWCWDVPLGPFHFSYAAGLWELRNFKHLLRTNKRSLGLPFCYSSWFVVIFGFVLFRFFLLFRFVLLVKCISLVWNLICFLGLYIMLKVDLIIYSLC